MVLVPKICDLIFCGILKLLTITVCWVSSWAFPQRQERGFSNSEYYQQAPVSQIPILHMEVKSDGADGYQYAYETGNKIAIQEAGTK